MKTCTYILIIIVLVQSIERIYAEPIVIRGELLKEFCGKSIGKIRLCNTKFEPIPYQIDEVTVNGNYICNEGDEPNSDSSNGKFDVQDELTFLSDDCYYEEDSLVTIEKNNHFYYPIVMKRSQETKVAYLTDDPAITVENTKYIEYDHQKQFIKTPYYYAQFGMNRFHFTRAGIYDLHKKQYLDLTNELAVTIFLKALWGLIPIHYSEDNLICIVKKYKTGNIRLIRGGNFHLNLGLGIKGSHAYVNQICYPQMVKVPVNIHVPIRFRSFFSTAYIEMCPVVRSYENFLFTIPGIKFVKSLRSHDKIDTLLPINPNNELFTVSNENIGYGWILQAMINDKYLNQSGFVFRRPSIRDAVSNDCGYRMMIKDLPKGTYEINNWVLFSRESSDRLQSLSATIKNPTVIITPWGTDSNQLVSVPLSKSVKKSKH